jgi:hypothetical protein
MENHFGCAHRDEISSRNVSRLWDGVSFIMQARDARSTSWGCPEVETACREQYAALPANCTAVASSISKSATALTLPGAARAVNTAYLQFFLPFW